MPRLVRPTAYDCATGYGRCSLRWSGNVLASSLWSG